MHRTIWLMKHGLEERMCSIRNTPTIRVVIGGNPIRKFNFRKVRLGKTMYVTTGWNNLREAPYIVSRYDTTTGGDHSIEERIGLLDRKLRLAKTQKLPANGWNGYRKRTKVFTRLRMARRQFADCPWIMLISFIEYYQQKFGKRPLLKSINYIAYIISWNVWQMDGLKGVIPNSCGERRTVVTDLFGTKGRSQSMRRLSERWHPQAQWYLLPNQRTGGPKTLKQERWENESDLSTS